MDKATQVYEKIAGKLDFLKNYMEHDTRNSWKEMVHNILRNYVGEEMFEHPLAAKVMSKGILDRIHTDPNKHIPVLGLFLKPSNEAALRTGKVDILTNLIGATYSPTMNKVETTKDMFRVYKNSLIGHVGSALTGRAINKYKAYQKYKKTPVYKFKKELNKAQKTFNKTIKKIKKQLG